MIGLWKLKVEVEVEVDEGNKVEIIQSEEIIFNKIKPDHCIKIKSSTDTTSKSKSTNNIINSPSSVDINNYQNKPQSQSLSSSQTLYYRNIADSTFYIPNEEDMHLIRYYM